MNTSRWLSLLLLLSLFGALTAQNPIRTGKDYALFFVVTDFDHWQDFPASSAQQVRDIERELKAYYGFKTEFVANPTLQQILDKLEEYTGRSFGKDDQLLVYFSMHGHYEEGRIGVLVPKDGKLSDPSYRSTLPHTILEDLVSNIPCRHITLALDACYSGTFEGDKGRPMDQPWEREGDCKTKTANALQNQSRLYLASGGKERTPINSQFAAKWLDALQNRNSDGMLSHADLVAILSDANPIPRYGKFKAHESRGDFVFVHKDACGFAPGLTTKAPNDPDGDNLPGASDECPTEYGSAKANGCPDYDEDGVPNKRDDCPYEAGTPDRNGCPAPADSDGDGVPDTADKCRYTKGLPKYEGCPDSDGDLVPDHLDQCPNEKGDPKNNGCKPDLPNFVLVNGGTYQMGSNDGDTDEKPVHQVTLSDFYLNRYEVTVEEFGRFIAATGYETDADKNGGSYFWESSEWKLKAGINWKYDATGKLRPANEYSHPVIHVSWNDAVAYCNWRSEQDGLQKVYTISADKVSADWNASGYRLPTEAEWEYAARSRGKDEKWAGTSSESSLSTYSNFCDKNCEYSWKTEGQNDGYQYTAPVGSFKANSLGLNDMTGNVWEFCWDWKADYPSSAQTNPTGPSTGSSRVLRGGSWNSRPASLRCAYRNLGSPGIRNNIMGFRLARAAR